MRPSVYEPRIASQWSECRISWTRPLLLPPGFHAECVLPHRIEDMPERATDAIALCPEASDDLASRGRPMPPGRGRLHLSRVGILDSVWQDAGSAWKPGGNNKGMSQEMPNISPLGGDPTVTPQFALGLEFLFDATRGFQHRFALL